MVNSDSGDNFENTSINFLPDYKIVDWSKLKAFADDNLKVAKAVVFVLDRVENIVGKGENAGYQLFSFSHKVFLKRSLKVGIVRQRVKHN